MKIRRTETLIETRELLLVRTFRGGIGFEISWCEDCGQNCRWLTAEQAADLRDVSVRAIFRWIESNCVHFTEIQGRVLICANALPFATAEELCELKRFE